VIALVARHQLVSLRRQRVLVATVVSLLAMTVLAGVIGWSSHNTIVRVYSDATQLLAADGQPAPPNPFDLKPTLSLLSNMSVYVPLIGALLALVIGHLAMVDDKTTGIGSPRASGHPQGPRRGRRRHGPPPRPGRARTIARVETKPSGPPRHQAPRRADSPCSLGGDQQDRPCRAARHDRIRLRRMKGQGSTPMTQLPAIHPASNSKARVTTS